MTSEPFSIRAARKADIDAMHRLRCSVRENFLSDPSRVTERSYLPSIQAGSAWIAQAKGEILGFAALDLCSSSVWALFVAPSAEGMGIGRALHRQMLESAREAGLKQLWLNTSPGTRAEHFYADAGWEKAGATTDGEVRLRIRIRA